MFDGAFEHLANTIYSPVPADICVTSHKIFPNLGKTMEKVLILILFLLNFAHAHDAEIKFEDKSIDNWILLIGANAKELRYDFCKYNATSEGTQCQNFPKVVSTNISKVCNCSVQHTETEAGSFNFGVNCKSDSSWCPKDLAVNYQQGSFEKPSEAEEFSATAICLVLSLFVNVFFIIAVVIVKYRDRVHSYWKQNWQQYISGSLNKQNRGKDQGAEELVAY
ncbi:Hypothetical predicted protein [Cloeon dipterum]|uniref:Uncharacterized protein n=1 Tax=Cloeon dipterum TaxID=197152 RepID=A0A8S1DB65_9INSE|nr:Hypothetical predicted protein [Cloeon dipterum]